LPEDLKALGAQSQNHLAAVEQHFMNNQAAEKKIRKFLETYKASAGNPSRVPASASNLSSTVKK
jgi:hypothetical protein